MQECHYILKPSSVVVLFCSKQLFPSACILGGYLFNFFFGCLKRAQQMTEIQILKRLNLLCECNVHEWATGLFSGHPYPGYNISLTELVTHVLYKISHQNMWFSAFNGLKNTFHTIFSDKRQRVACGRHIRCLVLPVWMSFRFFRGTLSRSIKKKKSQVLLFLVSVGRFFVFFFGLKKNVGSGLILQTCQLVRFSRISYGN